MAGAGTALSPIGTGGRTHRGPLGSRRVRTLSWATLISPEGALIGRRWATTLLSCASSRRNTPEHPDSPALLIPQLRASLEREVDAGAPRFEAAPLPLEGCWSLGRESSKSSSSTLKTTAVHDPVTFSQHQGSSLVIELSRVVHGHQCLCRCRELWVIAVFVGDGDEGFNGPGIGDPAERACCADAHPLVRPSQDVDERPNGDVSAAFLPLLRGDPVGDRIRLGLRRPSEGVECISSGPTHRGRATRSCVRRRPPPRRHPNVPVTEERYEGPHCPGSPIRPSAQAACRRTKSLSVRFRAWISGSTVVARSLPAPGRRARAPSRVGR